MRDFFGKIYGFPDIARLEHITRVGVPVNVGPGGGLEQEVARGKHSSAKTYEEEVRWEVIADLVRGRALVLPLEQEEGVRGLRVSLVWVAEETTLRTI